MRVCQLSSPREFQIIEAEPVPPAPGEIQVRVKSVGICGSDLHYYAEGSIGDVIIKYPVVLGHEPSGEIHQVGEGVTGWSKGDRALLEPSIFCYHCENCHSGRHNLCTRLRFLSAPPEPGFLREYVNLPAHNVLPLPSELDLDVGTLFEPLAVIIHSLNLCQPRFGETVAVFGAGPIGLLTIAALRTAGVGRIWSVEPSPGRRELARLMGADAVIDPTAADPVAEITRDTGKRGVDVAFDCATKENTVQQTADVLRLGGRMVVTGIPSEPATMLNLHVLRRKEALIYNVRRANHETETAIEMLRHAPAKFAPLLTHRLPLDQAGKAFGMLEHRTDGAAKVIIHI